MMNIEIKRLSPTLVDDYVRFFDETPHDDNVDEHKCYCVCWCSADHRIETDFSSASKRRDLAIQYVQSGVIQGYLAYSGDKVVGWCNANSKSECLHCSSWLRFMQPFNAIETEENSKVKSVFCFVIAPEMRRKGVAKLLLERVCEDAAKDGFDVVEAYPNIEFVDIARDFMGPRKIYESIGFNAFCEVGDRVVMRKKLK